MTRLLISIYSNPAQAMGQKREPIYLMVYVLRFTYSRYPKLFQFDGQAKFFILPLSPSRALLANEKQ